MKIKINLRRNKVMVNIHKSYLIPNQVIITVEQLVKTSKYCHEIM